MITVTFSDVVATVAMSSQQTSTAIACIGKLYHLFVSIYPNAIVRAKPDGVYSEGLS